MSIISCGEKSLPISIDLQVNVTKESSAQGVDLSTPVFVQSTGGFLHGRERARVYTRIEDIDVDQDLSANSVLAARTFFDQQLRPRQLAIGQAFSTAQKGYLLTGATGVVATFKPITNGSFNIFIDGATHNITALDFSTATTVASVATIIQVALVAAVAGTTCIAHVDPLGTGSTQFLISSPSTPPSVSTISFLLPVSPAAGTDISGALFMNGLEGSASSSDGYLPSTTDLSEELDLIATALNCFGVTAYGWVLDSTYRSNTVLQASAAAWAEPRLAILGLMSSSVSAITSGDTSDIASIIKPFSYIRTFVEYHPSLSAFPDMAILAIMLSVNYDLKDSTITAKFKDLLGVATVGITTTELDVLDFKRYNVFTLVGSGNRIFREGIESSLDWFMDDLVNVDNLVKDMQIGVYSVFKRSGKVPYNVRGQLLIEEAMTEVSLKYVNNGMLSSRQVLDVTAKVGFKTEPPFSIIPTPLASVSQTDRDNRIGPPMQEIIRSAGAWHELAINITMV